MQDRDKNDKRTGVETKKHNNFFMNNNKQEAYKQREEKCSEERHKQGK